MLQHLKSLYLGARFFYALAAIAVLFLIAFWFPGVYGISWLLFLLLGLAVLIEYSMLFRNRGLEGHRLLPEKFSNSDLNEVSVKLSNRYAFKIRVVVVDELPIQFQKRNFYRDCSVQAKDREIITYQVRPVDRGEYRFGRLNCFVSTPLGFVRRRYRFDNEQMVKVYPSFIQMKQFDFLAIDNRLSAFGLKKIRRIGHTMEFEQIKEYVRGDDVRTVNWKATAKTGHLMVNQYQDEKMQPIYSIIDTSRVMKMPFAGLKLVDYAINSTLAFSNVALKKGDKVGLIDFSNTLGAFLKASAKKTYLNTLLERLYNIDTKFLDSNYGLLRTVVKHKITQRSLLLLYTNFEHISALHRQLPYLQAIAKKHVLVVVFFKNTELHQLVEQEATTLSEIVDQTIAQQFEHDKHLMVRELQRRGIQTVLTAPEDLTVNTINKYLEIKARGIL